MGDKTSSKTGRCVAEGHEENFSEKQLSKRTRFENTSGRRLGSGSVVRGEKVDDTLYEVEDILDVRGSKDNQDYLIKWKSWDSSYNGWEPQAHLIQCQEILQLIWQSRMITGKSKVHEEMIKKQIKLQQNIMMKARGKLLNKIELDVRKSRVSVGRSSKDMIKSEKKSESKGKEMDKKLCDTCGTNLLVITRIQRNAHKNKCKGLACYFCGRSFNRVFNLSRHLKNTHIIH